MGKDEKTDICPGRKVAHTVRNIKIVEQLPNTKAGNHVAG
jgi:hypothetical protein